jgi:ComF family protein
MFELRRPAGSNPSLRLPSQCEVCRTWGDCALCGACVTRFAPILPRCERCGLRLGVAAPACGACLRHPPPFSRTVCVADYGFPWDRLIADFKFSGRAELATAFAPLLAGAVQASAGPVPDCVLPVPLSAQRLAERGYNQAWELARRTSALLRIAAQAELLQRPLETPHQVELSRAERQRNLRAAFMVDPRHRRRLQGRHLALIDDVMTTGATVQEATTVLLRAGAAQVDVWVLARTPEH